MYAFISTVIAGETQGAVRQMALGIFGNVTGTDTDSDGVLDRFVLEGVTPEIEVICIAGWADDVPANIRDRYSDLQSSALYQMGFYPPPTPTREYMLGRLQQRAAELGAERYWAVKPGDDLSVSSPADLVSRFVAF